MEGQNRLILWGWYSPKLVENRLILDIEKNVQKYGVKYPAAYEAFQQNKDAINSLYFHHSYAESDILMGQEYTRIALGKHYEILPHTIQTCHARVICFFNALMLPSKYALRGNHESSLIQFEQGIPQMIYDELLEITELPFKPTDKQIFLL